MPPPPLGSEVSFLLKTKGKNETFDEILKSVILLAGALTTQETRLLKSTVEPTPPVTHTHMHTNVIMLFVYFASI